MKKVRIIVSYISLALLLTMGVMDMKTVEKLKEQLKTLQHKYNDPYYEKNNKFKT